VTGPSWTSVDVMLTAMTVEKRSWLIWFGRAIDAFLESLSIHSPQRDFIAR
jgi:hypothetical protein